jgi:hypothetical protein
VASTDVRFVMAIEDQGFIRKLTEAEQALYDLQNTTKKTTSVFDQLWKGFTIGQLAVDGIRKGFRMLKEFVGDAITGAIEEEQSQHRLTTALEMTGRARGGVTNNLLAFAQAQMAVTTFTHEEVEGVMTLLAQLTKLDSEGIQKATKGAMGLASVLGMDLQSAAMMVTKAMEGNAQALARVGIRVDENIPKEQQAAAILEKLVALYPRANAELETMGGKIKQAKILWGEFQTELGKNILQSLVAPISLVTEKLRELNRTLGGTQMSYATLNADMEKFRDSFGRMDLQISPLWTAFRSLQKELPNIPINIKAMTDAYVKGGPAFDAYLALVRGANALFEQYAKHTGQSVTNVSALLAKHADLMKTFEQLKKERETWAGEELFGELAEVDIGEAIANIFPPEREFEMPPFLQELLNSYQTTVPKMTQVWKREFVKMDNYSAEFFQDVTRGFTNAFMQFRLSTEGFKDFFIGMWNAIKQAFFQILADMLARWLVMSFVRLLFPITPLMTGVGGILPIAAQSGFQGVVRQPTLFLAGEAGEERVSIAPTHGGGGGTTHLTINVYAWDNSSMEMVVRQRVVPILKEVYEHGGL